MLKTIPHNKGGINEPLIRLHISKADYKKIRSYANYSSEGIMPADMIDYLKWQIAPLTSNDFGKAGQKAMDENYLYICVRKNKWKRLTLDKVF